MTFPFLPRSQIYGPLLHLTGANPKSFLIKRRNYREHSLSYYLPTALKVREHSIAQVVRSSLPLVMAAGMMTIHFICARERCIDDTVIDLEIQSRAWMEIEVPTWMARLGEALITRSGSAQHRLPHLADQIASGCSHNARERFPRSRPGAKPAIAEGNGLSLRHPGKPPRQREESAQRLHVPRDDHHRAHTCYLASA